MPLDYTNSIPLYIQLKEKIEEKVMDGTYSGKVPSEREFMDEYYISRSTVRQAIDALVREGTLVKRPGKGTFVAVRPINDWLGNLSSTTETIENMGMHPGEPCKIRLRPKSYGELPSGFADRRPGHAAYDMVRGQPHHAERCINRP